MPERRQGGGIGQARPALFVGLRDKYREMRRMRLADAGVDRDVRRDDMRRLAARFPGALRELDTLPLREIERRVTVLDAVVAGATAAPPWADCLVRYHGWMRAALRIRRLADRASCGEDLASALGARYHPEPDEPAIDALPPALLEGLIRPEGGRLNTWVSARVAEEMGISRADVDGLLWWKVSAP